MTLTYVNWDSEVASTHVLKKVLEDQGFQVKMQEVDVGPMFAAVASGDADGSVAAWLPVQHRNYMDKYKGKLEDLGPNLKGTQLGLVVPQYVKANSINDLKKDADQFDHQIIGIEAGANMNKQTEKLIKDYDLDMELVESSSAAMASSLAKAYKEKKPIVVHIVNFLDAFLQEQSQELWVVMEFMEGGALTDVIDNNPVIQEDQIAAICLEVSAFFESPVYRQI